MTTAPQSANVASSHRSGWYVMAGLWLLDGTSTVMIFMIGVALPEIREDLPIRPIQEGLLGAAFFIALTTLSLPSAIWLSRFSPRNVTLIALVGMAVMALAQGLAPNYWVLFAARLGFMYMLVSRTQSEVMLIQQWFSGPRIATLNSITVASFGLGQLVAIGAIPLLLPLVGGWRGVHILLAVVYVIVAVVWLAVGRERAYRPTAATAESAGPAQAPIGVLRRHPVLFLLASTQFGGAIAWASFITFFPSYGVEERGMSLVAVGAIFAVFPIGGTIGALSVGYLSNRVGLRRPFIFGPGFVMPVLYLAILFVTPGWWAPFLLLLGIMTTAVVPIVLTFPFDLQLRPREVAIAVGLVRTITPLGSALGPIITGTLQETTGSLGTALLIVLPVSVTVGLIGFLLPETHPTRRLAQQSTASPATGNDP